MAHKFGFTSVNSSLNRNKEDNNKIQEQLNSLFDNVISGRVIDIILDENHPEFDNYGGWISVGTIFIEKVEVRPSNPARRNLISTAVPLLPNIKNHPLINEIVLLFLLPNKELYTNNNIKQYYYLNSISIWNNQHMNAFPNITTRSQAQPSVKKSYQAIEDGQTRKSSNEQITYDYGSTFVEKSNIHPLVSYAGDIILEGRWGNSIRFGSTVKSDSIAYGNDWSSSGEEGDPITIIRNGQPTDASNVGYLPIVENINKDQSSVYLTSNQTIPLNPSVKNNPALSSLPLQPIGIYNGSQIVLNSGRLVFNSKTDGIIISSAKSTSIQSQGPVGLFSSNGDIVLESTQGGIKIGSNKASSPLIKGDVFLDDFKLLVEKLQTLSEKLTGEPQLKISTLAAGSLKQTTDQILLDIETYKSNKAKTI